MRQYFNCAEWGGKSWTQSDDQLTERNLCVSCWKKEKELEGVHHCKTCGSFAMFGSALCNRCQVIDGLITSNKILQSKLDDTTSERNVCQVKNRALKVQVQTLDTKITKLQSKSDHPFRVTIYGWQGTMSEDYLQKVLKAAAEIPHVMKVEYRKR